MKKIGALLLILLMLGPTFALACSCCPSMHHEMLKSEISNANCCCSTKIVQLDPADLNPISNSDLVSHRNEIFSFLQNSVSTSILTSKVAASNFEFVRDQSPHRLSEIPLYLSNLVLRF